MTAPFGKPSDVQVSSLLSTVVTQPAGAQRGTTPLNQPLGSALSAENYIVRDGALELRPVLSQVTAIPNPFIARGVVSGGIDYQDVNGLHYYTAFRYNELSTYLATGGSWSSQPFSGDTVLTGNAQTRIDTAVIFSGVSNNIVVAAPDTRQELLSFGVDAGWVSLTSIVGAKRVAVFDNYVIIGDIYDRTLNMVLPQRIRWSDRGSSSSWTGGLSGFEDLLAARGSIQRIIALENRIVVFFDDEIWQGLPSDFPFTFRFSPIDQSVGCPYPATAAVTPQGIAFLSRDYQTYLLPKAGGAAQPIGTPTQRKIRSDITYPDRAFSVYDPNMQQYEMFYCASGDSYPRNAAFMDINSGSWSFQSFPVYLTAGFTARDRVDRSNAVVPVLFSSQGTAYRLTSDYTQDTPAGSALSTSAYWEFMPWSGDAPYAQKSVKQVRVDYDSPSASSLTVRTSPSNGDTFSAGIRIALPAHSVVTQAIADVQEASRYPVVRIEQESQRQRIHRVHTTARIGGR